MCYRPLMARRSYDQTCGIATALDIIGERWTVLIIRDLLAGPLRYTDLLESLPGIGTNLLARRLKDLEAYSIVRRRELPPPAASTVYELTEEGEELREPLFALSRWGEKYMELPDSPAGMSTRTIMLGFSALIDPSVTRGLRLRVGMLVPGEPAYVLSIDDGQIDMRQGEPGPDIPTVSAPLEVLFAIATRAMTIDEAETQGVLNIEGDRESILRTLELADASDVGSRRDRVPAPGDAA